MKLDSAETQRQAREIITHLAIGLLRQDEAIRQGTARPVTQLESQLQWAWDKLTALCLMHNQAPPLHLPELADWLHQPIEAWPTIGATFAALQMEGALLDYSYPSELCQELAEDWYEAGIPQKELDDLPFKEIMAWCKTNADPAQYTAARRFLVEHPYIPEGNIPILINPTWNATIRDLLVDCYERIPAICIKSNHDGQHIAICPRCGWPLEWRTQHRNHARCYGTLCRRTHDLDSIRHFMPYSRDAVRTRYGIQHSVTGAERPLLELFETLTQEYGLICQLWPENDNYDLYVELPRPNQIMLRCAIDMKDVTNPHWLGQKLHPISQHPKWDRAFYLFPDHRRDSNYLNAVQKSADPLPNTELMFVKAFKKWVEAQLQGGRSNA